MKRFTLAGAVASVLAASMAHAQEVPAPQAPKSTQPTPPPVKKLETITVTASPLSASEETMAQPSQVMGGEELRRKRASSLGDTLAQEPGVQSSSFGAGAGRPIIRGFDAARVQVLENGIGSLDVSTISPDHAVTVEPLRAQQIEILRGPATLLYGGGAIGGVVNVVTDAIPRGRLDAPTGAVEVKGGSANRLRDGGFDISAPASDSFVLHADAYKRRTKDYDIPGAARRDDPNSPVGTLPDSAVDSKGGSVGGSWVGDRGFLGASVSTFRSDYGIPSGEGSSISLKQQREDLSGELVNPFPGFVKAKIRAAYNDYEHREILAGGETATTFKNKAWESRLELLHQPWFGFEGAVGVHVQDRDFSALGDEAVVPRTKSSSVAGFIVEKRNWGAFGIEGGLRIESEKRDPDGDLPSRSFSPTSVSLGGVWKLRPDLDLHVSATRSQRAPGIEELYINGPHEATASFEVGNPNLGLETAQTLDVTLHQSGGPLTWKVTLFASRIRNYIYAKSVDANGDGNADRVDDFLLQNFTQLEALFRGYEAEIRYRPESHAWSVRLFTDGVRGTLDGAGSVPRLSPSRVGLDLEGRVGRWNGTLTVVHAQSLKHPAELETPTTGYTRVDAEIAYEVPMDKGRNLTLFLQGTNLSDAEIRFNTSYLKDVAPAMGRSFQGGLRYTF
jgi:iron complex outermembrane receptor protein